MIGKAQGSFEVKLTPQPVDATDPPAHGRLLIDKAYHGGLTATARGEMLAWRSGESGVYVAIERVNGVLDGRAGEFTLSHRGVMDGRSQQLSVSVAPGSATGELMGMTGELSITIGPDGAHTYALDYELP